MHKVCVRQIQRQQVIFRKIGKLSVSKQTLGLVRELSYGEDTYIVSGCNEGLYRYVMSNNWEGKLGIIRGSSGSGKTHLGRMWSVRHKAEDNFIGGDRDAKYFFIDDVDKVKDRQELFNFINYVLHSSKGMLMTTTLTFENWGEGMTKDLLSRLQSYPCIDTGKPDEEMHRKLLVRLSYSYGISISERVERYILINGERSFSGISRLVVKLHELVDSEVVYNSVGIELVKEALGRIEGGCHG